YTGIYCNSNDIHFYLSHFCFLYFLLFFFFFNDTATTEIYTLSLHDALPISYLSLTRSHSGLKPSQPRLDFEAPWNLYLARVASILWNSCFWIIRSQRS